LTVRASDGSSSASSGFLPARSSRCGCLGPALGAAQAEVQVEIGRSGWRYEAPARPPRAAGCSTASCHAAIVIRRARWRRARARQARGRLKGSAGHAGLSRDAGCWCVRAGPRSRNRLCPAREVGGRPLAPPSFARRRAPRGGASPRDMPAPIARRRTGLRGADWSRPGWRKAARAVSRTRGSGRGEAAPAARAARPGCDGGCGCRPGQSHVARPRERRRGPPPRVGHRGAVAIATNSSHELHRFYAFTCASPHFMRFTGASLQRALATSRPNNIPNHARENNRRTS
jgi:hypothetical protein